MSVIQKILVLMEKEKVNARKLTTDLGLSNSCITEWKKGKAKPSIEAVVKIAGYFGVTTDYLLTDSPEAEKERESGERLPGKGNTDDSAKEEVFEAALDAGNVMRRIYREHEKGSPDVTRYPSEISGEDRKLLDCYHRLDEEDREYIWCKMIVLEREAMD